MADTLIARTARERHDALLRQLVRDLRQLRLNRGISQRALAAATQLSQSFLSRLEAGKREPRLETLLLIATALGVEPSLRLFAAAGPRVHDRISAPITDALLGVAHRRWARRLEVGVTRPDRGVIDLVLADQRAGVVVATEIQGQLRRVEEQLRWAGLKADSLPSATGWPWGIAQPTVSRLLVLRSTGETRALVRGLPDLFRAAYPASESTAFDALTSRSRPWPGNALLWAEVSGGKARILDGAPRASGR